MAQKCWGAKQNRNPMSKRSGVVHFHYEEGPNGSIRVYHKFFPYLALQEGTVNHDGTMGQSQCCEEN